MTAAFLFNPQTNLQTDHDDYLQLIWRNMLPDLIMSVWRTAARSCLGLVLKETQTDPRITTALQKPGRVQTLSSLTGRKVLRCVRAFKRKCTRSDSCLRTTVEESLSDANYFIWFHVRPRTRLFWVGRNALDSVYFTSWPSPTVSFHNKHLWSLRPQKEWVNYFHQSVHFNLL